MTLNIPDKEVIIFSDFHWGKSRDIDIKLKANDEFIDWLILEAQHQKVKTLLFLGDWHDNRNSVSVKTYNYSFNSIQRISDAGLSMYMLVGNHDSYYKENIKTNSLNAFRNIPNIHIIDEYTKVNFSSSNKKAAFFPWDTYNELKSKKKDFDLILGHFEFSGADFNAFSTCKHGYSGGCLTTLAPLVFSGHFHLRKEYPYEKGSIITVGNPLQLDWGDYGETKGIHKLNLDTLEYDFIPNHKSPEHKKIYLSKLKSKEQNLNEIKGNYVKLIVDVEYQFDKVAKITNSINRLGPLKPCEIEFKINSQFNFFSEDAISSDEELEMLHMTKLDYLFKFVEKTDKEKLEDLDNGVLSNFIKSYYEKANEKVSD